MMHSEHDATVAAEVQRLADAIFDALDAYERAELARLGTGFTTYEDHGQAVCAALEARARAWRAAQP